MTDDTRLRMQLLIAREQELRDVWFVVALPVYLSTVFGWDFWWKGSAQSLKIDSYAGRSTQAAV